MKVIYTAGIKKKAQLWDFIVEKSKGIYDKIRSVFVEDDEATQEAIDLEREEGIEEGENFESLMGQQEISKTLREEAVPTESVEPDVLETYNEQQASAVNSIGEDIEIGYRFQKNNLYFKKDNSIINYHIVHDSTRSHKLKESIINLKYIHEKYKKDIIVQIMIGLLLVKEYLLKLLYRIK